MNGRPVLTAAEMATAEKRVIDAGTSVEELMERAGRAVADTVWRIRGRTGVLVLCGPGNNGGDGYVVARLLAERGCEVRVAALAEPTSEASNAAREKWGGTVSEIGEAAPAPILVDALFGTGLSRGLDRDLADALCRLSQRARHSIAVDLPSGVDTDSGELLSAVPRFDATVALGSLKPAHLLQPSAESAGRVVLGEIGIPCESNLVELAQPRLSAPPPGAHKYSRGYVLVAAGEMAGASALTAHAALRAGAGYVALASEAPSTGPHALVHKPAADAPSLGRHLSDERIAAVAIGPGLGTSEQSRDRLEAALASGHRLVLDADALNLVAESGIGAIRDLDPMPVLTPHEGEFARLFERLEGSKVDRAREGAKRADAVIVYKGNDTVIAAPDGRAAISPPAPSWLATAGTGDVLTGIAAARYAQTGDAFAAACEAVWLQGEAARRSNPFLIADDLLGALPAALAACL